MAILTVQQSDLDGEQPNFVSADAGGDEFLNNGRTFITIDNADASPHTATINSIALCNQGFDHDVDIVVPAGEQRTAGPFNIRRFNNSDDRVEITYDGVTGVTIAVVSL